MSLLLRRRGIIAASAPAGGGGTPLPETMTDLQAWYDPSDSNNYTIDTGVSVLNDLSGNGAHLLQASGTSQPAVGVTIGGNSLGALSFDGGDFLKVTGLTTTATNVGTWAIVMHATSIAGYPRIGFTMSVTDGGSDSGAAGAFVPMAGWNSGTAWGPQYNFNNQQLLTGSNNADHIIVVQRNGASITCYIDGGTGSTGTGYNTNNFAITVIQMGRNGTGGDYYTGYLGEQFWDASIDTDPADIFTYLNDKWAVY